MSCIELFSLGSHKTAMNFNIFKIKNADTLFIKQENIPVIPHDFFHLILPHNA